MSLPTDPAPSSVALILHQPSGKSRSVSGKPQSRSAGLHQWEVTFSYSLLEFDQRDELLAYLSTRAGRVHPFTLTVPTYSDNNGILTSPTAACDGPAAKNSTQIRLRNVDGKLKPFNLISVNGKTKVYSVSSPSAVVGGIQTVTITPPLRVDLVDGDIWNVKNVEVTVTLDEDDLSSKSVGMSAQLNFTGVEVI